jgi:ParB-like chromosome segregation protein Spo0J
MTTHAPTDLQIVPVPIDDLRPDPANPRKISNTELDALTRSLREFGFVQPVLARHHDKIVIGGHQRLVAARRLGWKTVPVIFLDLTDEQARLLNLALNRISGEWDEQLLSRLLADLKALPAVDLSLAGFSDEELKKLLKRLEADDARERIESFDLDAAFEVAERHPITQPGDLWRLGDHKLLCGDATSEADVGRLIDGKVAALLATDPPYLVDYQGGDRPGSTTNGGPIRGTKRSTASATRRNAKHWDAYHDPATSVEFFVGFLRVALAHLDPKAAVYQWHASRRQALVEQAWAQVGLLVHQTIIWLKDRPILTHSHYLWQIEPCFYG